MYRIFFEVIIFLFSLEDEEDWLKEEEQEGFIDRFDLEIGVKVLFYLFKLKYKV